MHAQRFALSPSFPLPSLLSLAPLPPFFNLTSFSLLVILATKEAIVNGSRPDSAPLNALKHALSDILNFFNFLLLFLLLFYLSFMDI